MDVDGFEEQKNLKLLFRVQKLFYFQKKRHFVQNKINATTSEIDPHFVKFRSQKIMKLIFFLLLTATSYVSATKSIKCIPSTPKSMKAIVVLTGNVTGTITFTQENKNTPTSISVILKGLKQGSHGFHGILTIHIPLLLVHEFGNLSEGCASTGGKHHF